MLTLLTNVLKKFPMRRRILIWCLLIPVVLTMSVVSPTQAVGLDSWTSRTSGTTFSLLDVTYGSGTFMAVGIGGTILTSPDGATWTSRTSGTANSLYGVTYGSGTFVVVGNNGTILTSSDEATWTNQTSGSTRTLFGVTYGGGIFVSVGDGGTILTSSDGTTWTTRSSGTTDTLHGVTYGDGTFVAVGTGATILTSPDGATWTSQTCSITPGLSTELYGVTYESSTFIIVGPIDTILTSPDGATWTTRTPGSSNYHYEVTYGGGTFVAVGDLGTILTSPDGTTWTSRTSGSILPLYGITYGNSTFVVVGGLGTIIQSAAISTPVAPSPPAAPSNLTCKLISTDTVELNWLDNSTNADAFKVERKTSTGSYTQIYISFTDMSIDTGLTSGETYTYRVRAYNTGGDSAYSNEATITIPGSTPPPAGTPVAPSNLTVNMLPPDAVELNWLDNSTDEDGFKIERKTGSGSYTEIHTSPTDARVYTDTGLTPGETYTYRVRAYNTAGDSAYSNEATITIPGGTPPPAGTPAAPSNLTVNMLPLPDTVELNWRDNSISADGFKIERKTGSGSYVQIATCPRDAREYTDSGLTPGETYTYRVRAYNTAGDSAYSNEATITIPGGTPPPAGTPAAPSNLTVNMLPLPDAVELSWLDNSTNADGFKVERKIGSGSYTEIHISPKDAPEYTDTGLIPGETYYYRVKAFNVSGESAYSNEVHVTMPGGLPPFTGKELPARPNVEKTKVWIVSFNKDVEHSTVNNTNVFVFEKNGKPVATTVELFPGNSKKINIIPDFPYEDGKSYYLYITDNIISGAGKKLKEPIRMEFTVL